METLSRKQREIQEREELILEAGRCLFSEVGYFGLTMDKVAKATEYSKGTIYQHFSSKEELLMALAIRTQRICVSLFERAATFGGSSRERMLAVGIAYELFYRLHRPDIVILESIMSDGLQDKVPEQLCDRMGSCSDQNFSIVAGIVRDAIAQGDLAESAVAQPEKVAFALWSQTYGAFSIIGTHTHMEERRGLTSPYDQVMESCQVLMDGYCWEPLSQQWDYQATYDRIRGEHFAEEEARAHKLERGQG
jgi:AcrR family transcriptional regulator